MAELPSVFSASETEDATFKTLPAGWYLVQLVKSSLHTTKAKTGKYLKFQFKLVEEENAGMLFTNLNIVNPNGTAERIAKSDLKKITEAVDGPDPLEDTEDLHGIDLMVKVNVVPATQNYPEKNEIKDYMSVEKYEAEVKDDVGDGGASPFG